MNTVVPISRDDERLETASRWVLKIDEGALSARDKVALGEWLDENPRHRDVLLEVAAVWDKADALSRLADFFPHESRPDPAPAAPADLPWLRGIAVAASLVVLAVTVVLLSPGLHPSSSSERNVPLQTATYTTEIGENKTVLLPDGSEVVLNTNSALFLSYTSSSRVLRLARGEILVRVAHDPSRPFSVLAGDRIVQAKGTEFAVEITADQYVEVMVTEGRVVVGVQKSAPALSDADNPSALAPPVLAPLADNTLSAGEEVTLGAPEATRKVVTDDEVEVRLSWKDGQLIFRSEPLEKALQEVERYTTVEFVLLDEDLKSITVNGIFRTGDVDALLVSLRAHFDITHTFDGTNRVLLSSL